MGFPHLHARSRDVPLSGVQVDFRPFCFAKLPWADKDQGGQSQGALRDEGSLIGVHGPEQVADLLGVGDCRIVGFLHRLEGALQCWGWVSLRPAGDDGIAEDLAAVLKSSVCGLDGSSLLYTPEGSQELWGSDAGNRALAQPGEQVSLKAAEDLVGMGVHPRGLLAREPFSSHHFEAIEGVSAGGGLLGLSALARVDPGGQELTCLVPLLPGLLEADVGVGAEGDPLLLALDTVLQAPPFAPAGGNFQVHAFFVGQLVGLGLGLGGLDGGIGQGHGGNSSGGSSVAPDVAPK